MPSFSRNTRLMAERLRPSVYNYTARRLTLSGRRGSSVSGMK